MFDDRLSVNLLNKGYRRLNSNVQGIYLFYQVSENELSVISVFHAMSGYEITQEQYQNILEHMKKSLYVNYSRPIKMLSLILTAAPNRVKSLATLENGDSHWIIDISSNRLIRYENESKDYNQFSNMLEQLLQEEEVAKSTESTYQVGEDSLVYSRSKGPSKKTYGKTRSRWTLTPITMTIIALNLIAYVVTHYTGFMGGEYGMLEKGALSWYYIKENKEFYRLLTSMFMHGDWEHLFNNMIVLLFIGSNLESVTGKFRYLLLYLGSGILAGLTSISYNMWMEAGNVSFFNTTISIGASGAIFGIVGAFLYIVIVNRGQVAGVSATQMVLFVVLSLYSGIVNSQIDQAAHVGGFVAGFVLAAFFYRRPARYRYRA